MMDSAVETVIRRIEEKVADMKKGGPIETRKAELVQLLQLLRSMLDNRSWTTRTKTR